MTRKETTPAHEGAPLPPSTLDLTSGREGGVRLCPSSKGMELVFFTALPRVKMHGLHFSAREAPSVIIGGRKQPVEGVF